MHAYGNNATCIADRAFRILPQPLAECAETGVSGYFAFRCASAQLTRVTHSDWQTDKTQLRNSKTRLEF
jgi:hypothetical protein